MTKQQPTTEKNETPIQTEAPASDQTPQLAKPLPKNAVRIVIALIVLIAGISTWLITQDNGDEPTTKDSLIINDGSATITNFEECVAAGNPVMESFPEQCSANGETFVDAAQSIDLSNDDEESSNSETNPESLPDTIVDLRENPIKVTTLEEIEKLTPYASASFIDFITADVNSNEPDSSGCILSYNFTLISDINVRANATTVQSDPNSDTFCGGGGLLLLQNNNGAWEDSGIGGQAAPTCDEMAATLIASEFLSECVEITPDGSELKPNPNGTLAEVSTNL